MEELKTMPDSEAICILQRAVTQNGIYGFVGEFEIAAKKAVEALQGRSAAPENKPLTVTLPCKIGDTIYEVEDGLPIISYHVTGFVLGKTEFEDEDDEVICERHGWQIEYGKLGIDCECPISKFGKSLFLTWEAAEQVFNARKPKGVELNV